KRPDDKAVKTADKPAEKPKTKSDDELQAPQFEFGGKGDFQFEQALNFLKGLPVAQSKIAQADTSMPVAMPIATPSAKPVAK
ncbi:MAG TPA: hypothetical protein VFW00_10720, partial [Rhodocyclaceae bacterium]|nr:hypothetical protein [Rhodocyclaceae bacterium]